MKTKVNEREREGWQLFIHLSCFHQTTPLTVMFLDLCTNHPCGKQNRFVACSKSWRLARVWNCRQQTDWRRKVTITFALHLAPAYTRFYREKYRILSVSTDEQNIAKAMLSSRFLQFLLFHLFRLLLKEVWKERTKKKKLRRNRLLTFSAWIGNMQTVSGGETLCVYLSIFWKFLSVRHL